MLRRRGPGARGNDRVRENALVRRGAIGSVISLARGYAVAELLRKQIRQIWSADGPSERGGQVREIAGTVRIGGNRNQAGIEPLALPGPLIIAEEERFVLLERA